MEHWKKKEENCTESEQVHIPALSLCRYNFELLLGKHFNYSNYQNKSNKNSLFLQKLEVMKNIIFLCNILCNIRRMLLHKF